MVNDTAKLTLSQRLTLELLRTETRGILRYNPWPLEVRLLASEELGCVFPRVVRRALVAVSLLVLTGCGGGGGNSGAGAPPPIATFSLSLNPASVALAQSGTQTVQVPVTLASVLAAKTMVKASAVLRSSTALPVASNQAPTLIVR